MAFISFCFSSSLHPRQFVVLLSICLSLESGECAHPASPLPCQTFSRRISRATFLAKMANNYSEAMMAISRQKLPSTRVLALQFTNAIFDKAKVF